VFCTRSHSFHSACINIRSNKEYTVPVFILAQQLLFLTQTSALLFSPTLTPSRHPRLCDQRARKILTTEEKHPFSFIITHLHHHPYVLLSFARSTLRHDSPQPENCQTKGRKTWTKTYPLLVSCQPVRCRR
jgi:hypothetical protein